MPTTTTAASLNIVVSRSSDYSEFQSSEPSNDFFIKNRFCSFLGGTKLNQKWETNICRPLTLFAFRSLVVAVERMRWVHDAVRFGSVLYISVSALTVLIGWQKKRLNHKNLCHLLPPEKHSSGTAAGRRPKFIGKMAVKTEMLSMLISSDVQLHFQWYLIWPTHLCF